MKTAQLAGQIRGRGENAPRNDISFDLGEPEFDLVKPRRVGGREVEMNPRILLEKLAHQLWS